MEYSSFLPMISQYLPLGDLNNNQNFKNFIREQTDKANDLSDYVMMTLPRPRVNYYSSSNYFEIQKGVTDYSNKVVDALGFFPISIDLDVLKAMEIFSQAILFLGLIFDIIILLFIVLSILLIYSLLMISVETKTFEFGVMRMVGIS
jgi:ABC-type antimicrobial peptide transport system permease subunit